MNDFLQSKEYKRCVFLCSRRAMLENELLLRKFALEYVPEHYTIDEVIELNIFLNDIFDNDLFDVIMGKKKASEFKDQYNEKFLHDIEKFAYNVYYAK
ncbi:MAG: succinate dehydrogenase assembly factor 2 [Flexistipes sinusarabici]|uniref:FAD assembly factor SdhE n=1 Tax=Flexistipes sinusarabici TaxID=2352 RepID=A0A5D0MIT6_FLESI|nr:succinate dehydrogenase assembly factor 2 [Flexistipes sinusarabici]TYB33644.1 MAG: succinate dehydrogenase assembly factor 2 [Flexistipes sinusarabici]